MKKQITTIILSLCLFSLASSGVSVEANRPVANLEGCGQSLHRYGMDRGRPKPKTRVVVGCPTPEIRRVRDAAVAFLCGEHQRLGAASNAGRLDRALLIRIAQLSTLRAPLKITNENLRDFDGLIKSLQQHAIITSLDLSNTDITDAQLDKLLTIAKGNLRELRLRGCRVANFCSIATYCQCLNVLDLSDTNIGDEHLVIILEEFQDSLIELRISGCHYLVNKKELNGVISSCSSLERLATNISGISVPEERENLRELDLSACESLRDFVSIANYYTNLEVLNLSGTNITDAQLYEILRAKTAGGRLRRLYLRSCNYLNEEKVRRWLAVNGYGHIELDF